MLVILHRIAVAHAVPDGLDNSRGDRDKVLTLAAQLTAEDAQLFYQIALNGRRDLPLSADPRSGLEMVLLRMLAFKPQGVPQPPREPLHGGSGDAERALAKKPEAPVAAPVVTVAADVAAAGVTAAVAPTATVVSTVIATAVTKAVTTATTTATTTASTTAETKAAAGGSNPTAVVPSGSGIPHSAMAAVSIEAVAPRPASEPMQPQASILRSVSDTRPEIAAASSAPVVAAPATAPVAAVNAPATTPAASVPLSIQSFDNEVWITRFAEFGIGGVIGTIAAHCCLQRADNRQLHFVLDQRHASFFDQGHVSRITELLSRAFGEPVQVAIDTGTPAAETPAAYRERQRQLRLATARQTIADDPNVRLLQDVFGAVLEENSIEPLDN
jgi:DNA polymerase-3 subunit gamma/tau